jgi:hypothetical protein
VSGESFFLGSAELFDGVLPTERRRSIRDLLPIHQPHRQAGFGIAGAAPGVMLGQSALGVGGDAGVEGAVSATGEIDGPGHLII